MAKILLIIILVVAFSFTTKQVYAESIEEIKAVSTQSAFIKYDLAFPGMLPDNPFYKLKVLRDRFSLGLISDPKNKIEFLLLQTDKGILASAILIDKKKVELAKQTALKAEHNYTLITYELYKLKRKLEPKLYEKLRTASLKHQEVLSYLGNKVSAKDKKIFDTIIEFSQRNWQKIEEYQTSEVIK